jgi:peptide/nickel transport system permease protein
VFGIVLNLIFLRTLGGVFSGGTFDAWPSEFKLAYIPMVLKHMFLPFLAIFLSGLFQGVYAWRTFFLIYYSEDYVEMAKARGLPPRMIERHYLLRPVLPNLITSFALLFISLWQEVVALESFFNVAGIGRLFMTALVRYDTPVIVGLVVTFAYLLAITVFLLDIIYALVDPRVRIESEGQTAKVAFKKRKRSFRSVGQAVRSSLVRWSGSPGTKDDLAIRPSDRATTRRPDHPTSRARPSFSDRLRALWKLQTRNPKLGTRFREMARYPSAVVGLLIIIVLIGVSIYTVIAIPYDEMIELWRGSEDVWSQNPKNAAPAWVNLFRKDDLPSSIILNSRDGTASKSAMAVSEEMTEITISFLFDFPYGGFPQDLAVYVDAQYDEKWPLLSLTWLTPDGREIEIATSSIHSSYTYYLSQDERLRRRLDGQLPMHALFADPAAEMPVPLKGTYELRASTFVFEEDADVDAEFVLHGRVYGLAGTDHRRRDLMLPLLWGMPVALCFGLLAAVGTSVSTMVIAAVGTWFGGWVDSLVQRIAEVNMILPFLPVSLMIYTLYSKSFWVILGVTVLLSIFGNAIKNYRAIFLQVKEASYIEAARAYGAGGWRIVFRYLIPRIIPVLAPRLVILVPGYVFLEATLAFLGVSDPVLPTWGKLIVEGLSYGLHREAYHLVLEPLTLLLLVGLAFVMLGLALERIFDPRLREM